MTPIQRKRVNSYLYVAVSIYIISTTCHSSTLFLEISIPVPFLMFICLLVTYRILDYFIPFSLFACCNLFIFFM